jgi:hypothetical protein
MTKIIWNGVTQTDCIDDIDARHGLADAAKNYDWARVPTLLEEHLTRRGAEGPHSKPLFIRQHMAVLRSR